MIEESIFQARSYREVGIVGMQGVPGAGLGVSFGAA